MKLKLLATTAILTLSLNVMAGEDVVYSAEGYCTLKKENVGDKYLKVYAKKLGMTPSKKMCKSFIKYVSDVQPKEWDYRGGKLYPGSVIKLAPYQIKKIKAIRNVKDKASK